MKAALCHLLLLIVTGAYAHSEPLHIKVGVNPNIWFAQPSVIIGEGWDREAGFILEQKVYPGPAHNLQAFVAGELDGVNNNAAAALLAHARGRALRIVAGTFLGDISIIAQPELNALSGSGLERVKQFRAHFGRKFRLATNPRGSLSDLTVRRWLEASWPEYESGVELIASGDQAQLQQLFLSRSADGCAGFGSLLWLFRDKIANVIELVPPDELMLNQPGGVLMIDAKFLEAHPREVAQLKALYERATKLIRDDPARAAKHIDHFLTSGFVPLPLLEASIRGRDRFFSTDPAPAAIDSLADYMVRAGYLKARPDLQLLLTSKGAQ